MTYFYYLLIGICLYAILGLSLNLALGYGGMVSLCHATFYGLGAYTSSLLLVKYHWSFFASAAAALLLTLAVGYVIAITVTGFEGDSFVLATLAVQVVVNSILNNWTSVTFGPYGISGIPRPTILYWEFSSIRRFAGLTAIVTLLVWLFAWRIGNSPYGRTLKAVRDDHIAASSLGKNAVDFRRTAFAVSAGVASIAGVLYASYASYIDATSFDLNEGLFILCLVIIGGAGNVRGPVMGAIVLVLLPEALRLIPITANVTANLREVVYGLLLILMLRYRPSGISGTYKLD